MKKKEFLKALDRCVKCGGCKAQCPTYDILEEESESARGRLRLLHALMEGRLKPGPKLNDKIFGCLLCGKCALLCPLGIDTEEVFYQARKVLRKYDKKRSIVRLISKLAFQNTDLSIKLARPFQKAINQHLVKNKLAPHDIEICEAPFRKTGVFTPREKIGRVAIFTGCTIKHVYPELSFSLMHVLTALNYEVVFPHTEVCCGAPFRSLGMEDTAIKYAEKNYDIFGKLNVDAIISLCPTCVSVLKLQYPLLIGKRFDKVYEISTFLAGKIKKTRKIINIDAVYHDPCHSANLLKSTKEPRELLKSIGVNLIEPSRQTCCGFGGTFSFFFKNTSDAILEDTCAELRQTKAGSVITSCPNCILQLSKTIESRSIFHVVELIEDALIDRQSLSRDEEAQKNSLSIL